MLNREIKSFRYISIKIFLVLRHILFVPRFLSSLMAFFSLNYEYSRLFPPLVIFHLLFAGPSRFFVHCFILVRIPRVDYLPHFLV